MQRELFINPAGCSICLHTKAALLQFGVGIVQPALLAPLSSLMFATRHFTYRIPSPIKQTNAFFKFMYKISKPIASSLMIASGLQTLLVFGITHWEMETLYKIHQKIPPEKFDEAFGQQTVSKDSSVKRKSDRQQK